MFSIRRKGVVRAVVVQSQGSEILSGSGFARALWQDPPLGPKYPTIRYLPKTIITIPEIETLNTL